MDAAHVGLPQTLWWATVILAALSAALATTVWVRGREFRRLRDQESRWRLALEVSAVGVFDHDHLTGGIYLSPEFCQLFGVTPDGPVNSGQLLHAVHPQDREATVRAIAQAHSPQGTGIYDVQHRIVRPNGDVRWIALRSITLFEGEGESRRAARTIGTAVDFTARRGIDEALHQVVRATHIGVFDHDHEKGHIYWSDEQRRNYGFPDDRPVTLPNFLACVHPEDRPVVAAAVRHAHDPSGDGLFDVEHRIVRPDGEVRWLITRSRTFFSAEGHDPRPIRTIGAVLDVTDRHRSEERLRQREQIHSAVVSQSTEGIALIDSATLRFVEFNDAACAMLGYTCEAFASLTLPDLAPDAGTAERVRLQIVGAQTHGGDFGLTELRCHDGKLLPVWLTGRPVTHHNRTDLALVWRDITGIQKAESELRRLNRIHRTLSHTNQMIIRADTEATLLAQVCRIAVEDAGFSLAWIGLLDQDGLLRPTAVAGAARGYVEGLKVSADDELPEGRGPVGRALRSGAHVIVNHIESDEQMNYWRDRVEAYGIKSSAAFPLYRDKRVAGVLSIHSTSVQHFGEREISLLDDMAADISFGLDSLDRTADLIRSRGLIRDIESTVRVGSFRLVLPDWSLWWSEGTPAVLGLPATSVAERPDLENAFEPEIALMLFVALDDAAQFGSPIDIDLPLRGTPAAVRWVRLFGVAKRREDGRTEVSCTLQDISERKRLEAEVLSAAEAERRRLASELHDNLGQILYGTSLLLAALAREARACGSTLTAKLDDTVAAQNEAMQVCRTLAHGAAPIVDGGLSAALGELAARTTAAGVNCTAVSSDAVNRVMTGAAALELYRIAQEAITNALKHAQCRHIEIRLARRATAVELTIHDDGEGLDPAGAGGGEGIGLRTMRYRAARAGGTLEVRSKPGHGTTVRVLVPFASAEYARPGADAQL